MATNKTVRVATGTKPAQYRSVNIGTTANAAYPNYTQTTLDDRTFETVFDVGASVVAGLKTVTIAGYNRGGSAPTVTSVTPSTGSTLGGDSVVIAGTGFTAATAVKFGATDAASYVVNSAIQITAVSPAGSAATVDVTVTTANGTSATSGADHFTFTVIDIAFVGAATGGDAAGASSSTFSYTVGNGSNRMLFMVTSGDTASDLVTGVTYAGVSMTLANKQQLAAGAAGQRWEYAFYLLNPASGANNVVISASGNCDHILAVAADYSGVKQSGQPDVSVLHQSTIGNDTLTTSGVTVTDKAWVVLGESGFSTDLSSPTGDANTIRRVVGTFGAVAIFDSGQAVSPAGPWIMSTTRTSVSGTAAIGHFFVGFDHA